MLSEEIIFKIWNSHPDALTSDEGVVSLSRSIEAAVLLEGWKEVVIAWEVCGSIHREYAQKKDPFYTTRQCDFVRHAATAREMLSAAPKPAQAEKQEPVKDEPVAWRFSKGTITKLDSCPHGGNWHPLYTRPQPDLTAEVERLREDSELLGNLLAVMHRDGGHHAFAVGNDQAMQDAMQVYYQQVERIAELEKLLGDVSYETRQYSEGFELLWDSVDAALWGVGADDLTPNAEITGLAPRKDEQ